MRRRCILNAFILLLVPVALVGAYFIHYWSFAETLWREKGYYYEDGNSIKHTLAASELYTALKPVLGSHYAERAVLNLGFFNERFEQAVRHPKDSASESAKDLCNNYIGVLAAQWRATHAPQWSLRKLALTLGDRKMLCMRADSMHLPPESKALKGQAIVNAALAAFYEREPHIVKQTEIDFQKLSN